MAESHIWHLSKNATLLLLSFLLLPLTTIAVLFALCLRSLQNDYRVPAEDPKTVLVTGVSMSKGLALARLFYRQGHTVIGADCHVLSPGRASRAIRKFYVLPRVGKSVANVGDDSTYVTKLLQIAVAEKIHLWISVSDVNAAIEDATARDLIERHTAAKTIQLGLDEVTLLDDKLTFMQHVKSLGLTTPDSEHIKNKDELTTFLHRRQALSRQPGRKQYLVKPLGVDDVARFDMALLPLPTEKETMARIEDIPFDTKSSYIVQEYIRGREYCTYSLVVCGQVRAFVACPSSGLLMHYTALPEKSPLHKQMLDFTESLAANGGDTWTGHISYDFIVEDSPNSHDESEIPVIYPIECNPRVHTAVVLYRNSPKLAEELLSVLEPAKHSEEDPLYPASAPKVYWIGQDLVESVLYSAYKTLILRETSFQQFTKDVTVFLQHVRYWKDGTFEIWDPMPFWWLYHVQWPVLFLKYLFDGRWHKANVSTGKLFQAK